MSMEGTKKTKMTAVWMVVLVVAVGVLAFVSGYYIGKANPDNTGEVAVIDDLGRSINLTGTPQRIVSTAPTPTEILFAVGAGSQVVGVDDYSDYPAAAANLTKVGSTQLNSEAILGLKPDLIISSDLVPTAQLDQFQQQGIQYVVLAARTINDVFKDIKLVGTITGHSQEANTLVSQLQDRVDAVTSKTLAENVSKPKVYVEYYPMWTYGPGSFGDDLIRLAGGTNIAANASAEYASITDETVIAANPDIIVYTSGPMSNETNFDTLAARPGWSGISAIANSKVYSLNDDLISRYGPRIVDALEDLAQTIHPELFQQ